MRLGLGLDVRLGQRVAAAASFDPSVEYSPDPGFDIPADWSAIRCSVSASALNFTGSASPSCTGTAAATLAAGTYRVVGSVSGFSGDAVSMGLAGNGGAVVASANGPFSVDIVVSTIGGQQIRWSASTGTSAVVANTSIKRIA